MSSRAEVQRLCGRLDCIFASVLDDEQARQPNESLDLGASRRDGSVVARVSTSLNRCSARRASPPAQAMFPATSFSAETSLVASISILERLSPVNLSVRKKALRSLKKASSAYSLNLA